MSLAILATYEVTSTSNGQSALTFAAEATASVGGTSLNFGLTVPTNTMLLANASSSRQTGARVYMDIGNGSLTQLKGNELGESINLRGSLDGYGARELTFTRFGSDLAPLKSNVLRSLRAVRMKARRGAVPSNYALTERTMFDGYVRDSSFVPYPAMTTMTAQDTSLNYATIPMVYSLAAGSGRTRLSIILGVLGAAGIPVGTLSLPGTLVKYGVIASGYLYTGDGGNFFKGISEAGDSTVLDWLAAFCVPMGCRPYWRNGAVNIKRFSTSGGYVRTLKAGDIKSISFQPPNVDSPNTVRGTALVFAYTGRTGQRTEVKTTRATATYAPLVATNKQDHTTGVVAATGLASSSASREVSRVVTTTNYDGGTVISQTIEEWAYYAPRAARKSQAVTTGVISWNPTFDCWQYADGSWRTTAQEDFQIVRRTVLTRTFDANGYLTNEQVRLYQFMPTEIPLGTVAAGVETPAACLVTDDGHAWSGGMETLTCESVYRSYSFDSSTAVLMNVFEAIVSESVTQYPQTSLALGATYFGPFASKRYGATAVSSAQVLSWWDTYVPIDETQYRYTVAPQAQAPMVPSVVTPAPPPSSTIRQGSVPLDELLTSQQKAQPTSVTLTDQVRQTLFGKQLISYEQNDYCETDGELQVVCLERLREMCSTRVQIEMDPDLLCEEGETVAIDIPSMTNGVEKLLIWDYALTISGNGQHSQSLGCLWRPPELA